MPELPEVETVVSDLRAHHLIGKKIDRVRFFWPKTAATPHSKLFQRKIKNRQIKDIYRRAKYIVMDLSENATLLVHLRMTGKLYFAQAKSKRLPHEHVFLTFNDMTQLRFNDTRKFGRWYLIDNLDMFFKKIGPEPLSADLTDQKFFCLIKRRSRMLKSLLLDQSCIAGIGNIYADESLWLAKIHPKRLSSSLSRPKIKDLKKSLITVLERAINNCGTSLGKGQTNYYSVGKRRGRNQDGLNVFRRTGEPCPRCQKPIKKIIVAQRSTHFCSHCQK